MAQGHVVRQTPNDVVVKSFTHDSQRFRSVLPITDQLEEHILSLKVPQHTVQALNAAVILKRFPPWRKLLDHCTLLRANQTSTEI